MLARQSPSKPPTELPRSTTAKTKTHVALQRHPGIRRPVVGEWSLIRDRNIPKLMPGTCVHPFSHTGQRCCPKRRRSAPHQRFPERRVAPCGTSQSPRIITVSG